MEVRMNLANKLTILRILLVPIMVIIPFFNIQGQVLGIPITYLIVDVIFIIAAITDKLDGYIARSRNQITTFGKFLDPIADKIVVITAMVMLVEWRHLPAWIPIVVILREFIVSGYRLVAVEKSGNVIAANIWGKLKTVTQMIGLIIAFLDPNPYGAVLGGSLTGYELVINVLVTLIMSVSVIATVFSGWEYVKGGKDLFKGSI
jgi:CDP-diacylglycerol--glycerol-3-phosphate 3-phosphatidyltransferase